jgi:hypothetical protein
MARTRKTPAAAETGSLTERRLTIDLRRSVELMLQDSKVNRRDQTAGNDVFKATYDDSRIALFDLKIYR